LPLICVVFGSTFTVAWSAMTAGALPQAVFEFIASVQDSVTYAAAVHDDVYASCAFKTA
jgi:hypothetical protein